MRKIPRLILSLLYVSVGCFAGNLMAAYFQYRANPNRYISPWYSGVLAYGAIMAAIILIFWAAICIYRAVKKKRADES